jgi:hypothetical protein
MHFSLTFGAKQHHQVKLKMVFVTLEEKMVKMVHTHTLTYTHTHTHTHTHTLSHFLSHVHTCLVSIRSNSVWFGQVNFFELLAKRLLRLPMFSQSGFTCNASREARKYHRIGSLQKSIETFSF